MSAVSFEELDQLAGELLPERTVLSLVTVVYNNTTNYTFPSGQSAAQGGGQGTTVADACQATNSPGTPGLLGSLGLGSSAPSSSVTCVPAAVVSH